MTNDSSMDSTAKLLELYGPEEQQMTRGPGRNKRRLPLLDERKFRRAVSVRGASERAAAEIWNIIQSDEKQISRGRAERLVAAELKPWIDAMQDEPFLRHDGSTVALPVVDLKPCLQHLCQKSVDFRHAIEKALEKGPLTPIIFCDEESILHQLVRAGTSDQKCKLLDPISNSAKLLLSAAAGWPQLHHDQDPRQGTHGRE